MQDFTEEHDWVAEHVLALARELDVDAFDVGPAFAGAARRGFIIHRDWHPNDKGHQRTAHAVADLLYSRHLAARPSNVVETWMPRPVP